MGFTIHRVEFYSKESVILNVYLLEERRWWYLMNHWRISKPLEICQSLQSASHRFSYRQRVCVSGAGAKQQSEVNDRLLSGRPRSKGQGGASHLPLSGQPRLAPGLGQSAGRGTAGISFHPLAPAQAPGCQSGSESCSRSATRLLPSSWDPPTHDLYVSGTVQKWMRLHKLMGAHSLVGDTRHWMYKWLWPVFLQRENTGKRKYAMRTV